MDAQFDIGIEVKSEKILPAVAQLQVMSDSLTGVGAASSALVQSLRQGEAAYASAETAANRAATAVERIGLAADAQRGKLEAAMKVGDEDAARRAADKLSNLVARQGEAIDKSNAAKAAMDAQAASLDRLKGAAGTAADAQSKISKELGRVKDAQAAVGKAASDSSEATGNLTSISRALGKLGGPLGDVGQKGFGTAGAVQKLTKAAGAAGPYIALAVAIAAIAVGAAALAIAAGKAAFEIVKWSFSLNPANVARYDEQTQKLKANMAGVFGGLKFDKVLGGFDRLVAMFDKSSVTGKAIKVVFESLFQPLVDGAGSFIPKIELAFVKFEILVLKALIAIKPFGSKILLVAEVLGGLAALVLGVVVVAIAVVIANLALLALGFSLIVAAIVAVTAGAVWLEMKLYSLGKDAVGAVIDGFNSVVAWFQSFSLVDIGTQMVAGLVQGITGAGGAILEAMKGAVSGAIDGAKKLLGIASPSKVFAEIGMHTGEGMAQGVDSAAGSVQSSLESMVSPPEPKSGAALTPAKSSDAGGDKAAGATFIFNGVEGAEDALSRFEALVMQLRGAPAAA